MTLVQESSVCGPYSNRLKMLKTNVNKPFCYVTFTT